MWSTAVAAAAAIVVGVTLGLSSRPADTPEAALEQAVQFFVGDSAELAGHLLSSTPPPAGFAPSRDVIAGPEVRWRWVEQFGRFGRGVRPLGRGGRPCNLVCGPANGSRPARAAACGACLEHGRLFGRCLAGRRRALYVLVVEGDSRAYRGTLNPVQGPLT